MFLVAMVTSSTVFAFLYNVVLVFVCLLLPWLLSVITVMITSHSLFVFFFLQPVFIVAMVTSQRVMVMSQHVCVGVFFSLLRSLCVRVLL